MCLVGLLSDIPLLMMIISEATEQQQSVEEPCLQKLSHVHVWLILYVKVVQLREGNQLECRPTLGPKPGMARESHWETLTS